MGAPRFMVSAAALDSPSPVTVGQQGQEAEGLPVLGELDWRGVCPSSLPTMNTHSVGQAGLGRGAHTRPAGGPQECPRSMPSDGRALVSWKGWPGRLVSGSWTGRRRSLKAQPGGRRRPRSLVKVLGETFKSGGWACFGYSRGEGSSGCPCRHASGGHVPSGDWESGGAVCPFHWQLPFPFWRGPSLGRCRQGCPAGRASACAASALRRSRGRCSDPLAGAVWHALLFLSLLDRRSQRRARVSWLRPSAVLWACRHRAAAPPWKGGRPSSPQTVRQSSGF